MKNSKQQIASAWDKIASEYGSYRRKIWPPVSDFLAKSKPPLLDIGCGNANYLRKTDIGIDISFKTCKLAKKHLKPICADASSLPIKPNSFSRVLSVATVHHLPFRADRENFFAELQRVLKPGGEALVTALYRRGLRKNIYKKWGKIKRFYHLFSKRELARLASKHFNNIELKREGKNLFLWVN